MQPPPHTADTLTPERVACYRHDPHLPSPLQRGVVNRLLGKDSPGSCE
jgi:hypothetical protein